MKNEPYQYVQENWTQKNDGDQPNIEADPRGTQHETRRAMTDTLTVGIIGCGEITSKRRADQFVAADGIEIGMAMDIEESVATDIGERYDVPHTTDQEELLAEESIDIVYIATPHHLHAEQAIAAAESGKHVLVEKPITVDIDSASEVIDSCCAHGVKLCVFEPYRYHGDCQTAKELIEAGYLGEIVGTRINIWARKPESYWTGGYTGRIETDWRMSRERSGGGVLSINGIHNIDGMAYLTGLEPERVACEYDTLATPVDVEDFCVATVRYRNGAIGIIEASSFLQNAPYEESVRGDRVYGTEGELVVSDPVRIRTNEETDLGEAETWHTIELDEIQPAGVRLIEEFAEAIRTDTEPPVTGEEGRAALELVQAAYTAGNKGETVTLPISD